MCKVKRYQRDKGVIVKRGEKIEKNENIQSLKMSFSLLYAFNKSLDRDG